jgi:hypothetical protein
VLHFSVDARVACADGLGGQTTCVIIDPADQKVTHLVVKENRFPYVERLVSVDRIVETTPELIRLNCTKDELAVVEPFVEFHDVRSERPCYKEGVELYFVMPHFTWPKKAVFVPVKCERIPTGERAVRRGARVEATDGLVGHVHEFLMASINEPITHLVLRDRVLWSQKQVVVPVSGIDHLGEKTVYLKLDRHSVESLPTSPVDDD